MAPGPKPHADGRLHRHQRLLRQEGPREAAIPEEREAHAEEATFEIVVGQLPTRARIDPCNKLIDRVSDDNEIEVSK